MNINLSAEMVYGLYMAAKKSRVDSMNWDKEQYDLMTDYIRMVEEIADSGIPKIIKERLKSL